MQNTKLQSLICEVGETFVEMSNEFRSSSQLRSTILSVVLNMMLTLTIWIGVYGMEKNSKMSEMYFLGSTANHTTGNQIFDGMINGFGTIMVLGAVSFIMLGFALFDFQRVVKTWLTTSCLLILYGVSGYTAYDFCERYFDISTDSGLLITSIVVATVSAVYGSFGVVAFFQNSSIRLHQFYVISNCSLIAVFYLRVFPGDTTWFVLWTVVLWDFFAVLAPIGPLKKVQEKAQDYSKNVLKLLMFSAEEKRNCAGGDKIKTGVKELIEMYSRNAQQDREFVEKILQRRKAINPDSDNSPLLSPREDEIAENDEGTETCEEFDSEDLEKEKEKKDKEIAKEVLNSIITSIEQKLEEKEETDLEDFLSSETEVEIPVSDIRAETERTTQVSEFPSETTSAVESENEEDEDEDEMESENEMDTEYTAADALNDGESVRLGFGDFVFYSLLIGQAATGGSVIATLSAGFGIVSGLIATLTVLASPEHTTPALPMSVLLGTFYYFYSTFCISVFQFLFNNLIE